MGDHIQRSEAITDNRLQLRPDERLLVREADHRTSSGRSFAHLLQFLFCSLR